MVIDKRFFCLFLILILIGSLGWAESLEERARQHYKVGNIYYEHGLYQEAEREFRKALELLEKKEKLPRGIKEEEIVKEQEGPQYVVGIGDILSISVWENPDLTQDVIVRPDGKISFPLIDEVQAAGLTISELDRRITNKLKEYIRFPDVSISLKKMGGRKVIILGQVRSPGVYSLSGSCTLLEAIALAGGFTNDAVTSSVIVIKGGLANPKAERINLARAIRKPQSKQNIVLESEDIIFVPKKFIANLNYFLKQILDPISRGIYTATEFKNW
ncbi:MAG TPA: hypothetical protein ENI31_05550 [Candidatus Omnitrophica bacterium]|nr:hypothetical protein [Candidatus Omnitrophota bacterium]